MSERQRDNPQILVRAWRQGDEDKIVDLLNYAYPSGWGNSGQWEWRYPQDPSFESSNVFIIESDGQIIGHRGSHPRQLVIRGKKIPVFFLGDTAVNHNYQELGLYSNLHSVTLEAARNKGACLALTQNSRGSITYNHNKKTGFVEIKQNSTYIKPINYSKVFKEEVSAFISRREELKSLLRSLETELYIQFDETVFSLKELLDDSIPTSAMSNKRGVVRIILVEDSLPLLIKFVFGGKLEKVKSFLCLLLGWKVKIKMKVRFDSVLTLGKIAWLGIRMMKYV